MKKNPTAVVKKIISVDHPDFAHLGLRMAIHDPEEDYPVSSVLDRTGAWEGFLTRQIIALLDKFESPAFYDIGANIGWYSLIVAGHLRQNKRQGQIFSVEPVTPNRDCLTRSITLNGLEDRIQIIAGAASDHNGSIALSLDPINFGNHRVTEKVEYRKAAESAVAYRLDDLIDTYDWPLPTLIKADVQGHEMQALRGFGKSLDRSDSWILAIEWTPGEWSLPDMVDMLGIDGLYLVDDQSRKIIPSSHAHLTSLLSTWPSNYFDLILTRGEVADRSIRALRDFEDRFQVRFTKRAGALMQNDHRRVSDGALALIQPLRKDLPDMAVMLSVKVIWTPGKTAVKFRAKGSDGTECAIVVRQGEIAEIPLMVGSGPARVGVRMIGSYDPDVQDTVVLGPIKIS